MSRDLSEERSSADAGQVIAVLGVLTLIAVLAPLFAFAQGIWLLLAVSGVTAVAAATLAAFALSHGLVDDEEEAGERGATSAGGDLLPALVREKLLVGLRRVDIFQALPRRELRLVAEIGELRGVSRGDLLGRPGRLEESIYVVLEGELRLLTNGDGRAQTVRAGEATPLVTPLERAQGLNTVQAAADGMLFVIPRARFLELCELQPGLGFRVYRSAAHALARRS